MSRRIRKDKNPYATTKIWKTSLANLRLLSGYRQKSMVEIIDEVVAKELDKEIKKREKE